MNYIQNIREKEGFASVTAKMEFPPTEMTSIKSEMPSDSPRKMLNG